MKIGGADYSDAELPEGVADTMFCIKCNGPMTHIGKGLFVCFVDRTFGTEMESSAPAPAFVTMPPVRVGAIIRTFPPDAAAMKMDAIDRSEAVAVVSDAFPPACRPSTHRWSKPLVKIVTIEQTSVKCDTCGTVLRTNAQGDSQEVMADLLRQIPQ